MYSTLIRWLPRLRRCSLRVLSAPRSLIFMPFPKDEPGGDLTVQPSGNISLIGTAAALDYAVLLSLFCQLFLLNCNLLKSNLFGTFLKEQAVAFPPPHRQSRRIIASNRVLNNCITLNILHSGLVFVSVLIQANETALDKTLCRLLILSITIQNLLMASN